VAAGRCDALAYPVYGAMGYLLWVLWQGLPENHRRRSQAAAILRRGNSLTLLRDC
jgi:hypothetical protein